MSIKKRVVSLFLCFALGASMMVSSVPTVSAVELPDQSDISEYIMRVTMTVTGVAGFDFPTGEVRMDTLESVRDIYNNTLAKLQRGSILPIPDFTPTPWDLLGPAVITEEGDSGVARLIDSKNNVFITDEWGNYPYCYVAGDVPAEDIAVENVHANVWLGLTERSPEVETVTQDALATAVIALNDAGIDCSLVKGYYNEILYYFICTPDYKYYCNSKGEMFVAPAEASATDLKRPHYNDDGDTMETPVIDRDNQTLNLPMSDGTVVNLTIDNMTYDDGDKSYTVNAYTTINEGDEYHYTYYTYNVQYNITNTYITYIGSNEPYEREEYELYYELPDGRSSADLTAEEIAGMSFEFYDVMNYRRSTDNVSVRALYHFDGSLEDSSYFTAPDRFSWNNGASITYMESPSPFGGNLYLDNTAHSFDVFMPSIFAKNDFTIQFRYYQASEPDTQSNVENSLSGFASSLVNDTLLKWDEAMLYDANGASLASLPIGTWNEIGLVRQDGVLYYYLNGHCIGQISKDLALSAELVFDFGSTSRAYSMLDEFRVLNFALVDGGQDYVPTAVPHDSNLVLVLPGTVRPVADEYWEVTSSKENLLSFDISTFTSGSVPDYSPFGYVSSDTSFEVFDGYSRITRLTTDTYWADHVSIPHYEDGFRMVAGSLLSPNKTYTVSVVLSDGSVESLTFTTPSTLYTGQTFYYNNNSKPATGIHASHNFGDGYIHFRRTYNTGSDYYPLYDWITIAPKVEVGAFLDIMYIELVEGDSTDLACEWITAIYDSEELVPNTAAIQTTIPVAGYTVGGVRPSMPAKGDLWFPVMENRITGVQIYAGTHWEEVNARWWTGSRWIPIYAFDINTLEDLFDIADGDDVVSLLPDTNSFFRWWQLQWLDFRQWLEKTLGSSGGGSAVPDDELLPPIQDDDGNGLSFIGLLGDLIVGIWDLGSGLYTVVFKPVFTNIGSSVSSITDVFSGEGAFDISVPEGGSIWD